CVRPFQPEGWTPNIARTPVCGKNQRTPSETHVSDATQTPADKRMPIGRAVIPVQFGEQVIVSILYNHDANPVHHRPDHAIQWMLGLLSAQGVGASEGLG